jgi:hypothetical protein
MPLSDGFTSTLRAERAVDSWSRDGGLLVGPFLTDEDKNLITSTEAARRHAAGIAMAMTITYLAVDHPVFEETVPDVSLREALHAAVQKYDPAKECVILLLASNVPYLARIVGTLPPEEGFSSPRASYEGAKQAVGKLN